MNSCELQLFGAHLSGVGEEVYILLRDFSLASFWELARAALQTPSVLKLTKFSSNKDFWY